MARTKKRPASDDEEKSAKPGTKKVKQSKVLHKTKAKKGKKQKKGAATKPKPSVATKVAPKKAAAATLSAAVPAVNPSTFHLESGLTDGSWRAEIADQFGEQYFKDIEASLRKDYQEKKEIFPPPNLMFNALNLTSFDKVKVVILGQDPYHDVGQAHGLSFSVPKGVKMPPSLKNIYKELENDIPGFVSPEHGCLEKWAKEGVLLLNATLSVEAHKPNSHAKYGWQKFTDHVIQALSSEADGVVFILWGGFAQKKAKLIDSSKHTVIECAHPSPLSVAKFMGCKCFSKTNAALKKHGKAPVDWTLE